MVKLTTKTTDAGAAGLQPAPLPVSDQAAATTVPVTAGKGHKVTDESEVVSRDRPAVDPDADKKLMARLRNAKEVARTIETALEAFGPPLFPQQIGIQLLKHLGVAVPTELEQRLVAEAEEGIRALDGFKGPIAPQGMEFLHEVSAASPVEPPTAETMLEVMAQRSDPWAQALSDLASQADSTLKAQSSDPATGALRQMNLGVLSKVGIDWTVQASEKRYPNHLVGRREELDQIWGALDVDTHGNAILVGDPGVGKTELLRGIAQDILDGNAPTRFKNARVIGIDIAKLTVEALDDIVSQVKKARTLNPPVELILVLDEIEEVKEGAAAQSNILRELRKRIDDPTLQLHVLGAANPNNYQLITGSDAGAQARFGRVRVVQPVDGELSATVLDKLSQLEKDFGIAVDKSAANMAIQLSRHYNAPDSVVELIQGQSNPRAALRLLDRAASFVARELNNREGPSALRQANAQLQLVRSALKSLEEDEVKELAKEGSNKTDPVREMKQALTAQFTVLQKKVTELSAKAAKEKEALEKIQLAAKKLQNPSPGDDPAKLQKAYDLAQRGLEEIIDTMPPKRERLYNMRLDAAAVARAVSEIAGRDEAGKRRLSVDQIAKEMAGVDPERIKNIRKELDYIIGQDDAKDAVANSFLRRMSGVGGEDKLLDVQFFAGPSGAGKTALVKKVAEVAGDKLERFDGGDFMKTHELSKLIGAPDGYVGYDPRGGLLFQLCKKYATLKEVNGEMKMVSKFTLLFDEAEKFHPDLFLFLMNAIDEGYIRWKDEIIYLYDVKMYFTSNLGNQEIFAPHSVPGQGAYDSKDQVHDEFMQLYNMAFRPEIRNRLPEPVIFNPHGPEQMKLILGHLLEPLFERMDKMEVPLTITDLAIKALVDLTIDKAAEFGGRELEKRTVPQVVENPIANEVTERRSKGKDQDYALTFDFTDGKFVVRDSTEDEARAAKTASKERADKKA